jgi:hypothetical protein
MHHVDPAPRGLIIAVESYSAWCRLCDSPASPAARDSRDEARYDLAAHVRIQHADEVTE